MRFGHVGKALFEDQAAQFKVRWSNVRDQTHRQTRQDTLINTVQRLRRAVGSNDEAFAGTDDCVDGVEELFLRRYLADDELNIVDQQHIDGTQARLEFHDFLAPHRGYKFHHEFFCRHINDLRVGVYFRISMTDGMHQVGFTLTRCRLKIKGIEKRLVFRRDAFCSAERENIGLTFNEIRKRHPRIKCRTWRQSLVRFLRDNALGVCRRTEQFDARCTGACADF